MEDERQGETGKKKIACSPPRSPSYRQCNPYFPLPPMPDRPIVSRQSVRLTKGRGGDNGSVVLLSSDKPPEPLTEFDDGLGKGVMVKRSLTFVGAPFFAPILTGFLLCGIWRRCILYRRIVLEEHPGPLLCGGGRDPRSLTPGHMERGQVPRKKIPHSAAQFLITIGATTLPCCRIICDDGRFGGRAI